MLTDAQLEARVLGIADVVHAGGRHEDGLVELKAEWLSPEKTARRLAAHANAARGEAVLWIVGLDEKRGVCDPTPVDLATWWPQVEACFDGPAPSLHSLIVRTEDGPVHALYFDVARAPFVIKNPTYGSPGGGSVEREVPWREGTRVRSATREDLIRLLVPTLRLPEIEILDAIVQGHEDSESRKRRLEAEDPSTVDEMFDWQLNVTMYVTPPHDELVVLPVHRTHAVVRLGSDGPTQEVEYVSYAAPAWGTFNDRHIDSVSVETTSSEAIVHLPGRLKVRGRFLRPLKDVLHAEALTIAFSVQPVHTDRILQVDARLLLVPSDEKGVLKWEMEPA